MKSYTVLFLDEAEAEIFESYEWGRATWGQDAAEIWVRLLYEKIYDRLAAFPQSCPIAPENALVDVEIRQLVFQRYRVLFEIDGKTVIVHHLAGPFIMPIESGTVYDDEEDGR